MTEAKNDGLYLALFSIHGLIRGENLELGRDADTGGQTTYVVEVARALAETPGVERVDLFTRIVDDPDLPDEYAAPEEDLSPKAHIVRLECGPPGYIRKEALWEHLDSFADNAIAHFRTRGRTPDLIHSHYADAGYVGVRLAHLLGAPIVHTGHSLGRVKRRRLLAAGLKNDEIEARYNMVRRIEAEEDILANANLVIASTQNEIEEQYGLYDYYQPERMAVVPPGTDLLRFRPPTGTEEQAPITAQIDRFLRDPAKPPILALSRPDERKNITTLVEAFGQSQALREAANLVIVAGNREDIRDLDSGAQQVLTEILLLVDRYDLYGQVAYPKHHQSDEVPEIYRLVAARHGVFINPALTEPFGLTLIEAAASGLPIVATEDGGPRDIVANCHNGILIDPLDTEAMADSLLSIVQDEKRWRTLAGNGLSGVERHYSWEAHAQRYMEHVRPIIAGAKPIARSALRRRPLLYHDRAVFTDLDQTLLGDENALRDFIDFVRSNRKCASFGIATGRGLESALQVMKQRGIPQPDVLITGIGTAIHYAPDLTGDRAWSTHIEHLWNPKAVRRILDELSGLELQPKALQSRFKVSYYIDQERAPTLEEIQRQLHQAEQTVNTFLSFGQFLDVVPVRASKGLALRYFSTSFGIPLDHILVAGGSGADEDMIRGNTLAVVVASRHHEELSQITDADSVYFAQQPYARGILEAIDHFDFYGSCHVPNEDPEED